MRYFSLAYFQMAQLFHATRVRITEGRWQPLLDKDRSNCCGSKIEGRL